MYKKTICFILVFSFAVLFCGCVVRREYTREDDTFAEACIKNINGIPMLFADGNRINPILFAVNEAYSENFDSSSVVYRQTKAAIDNGVNILRVQVPVIPKSPDQTQKYLDQTIKNIRNISPDVYILLYYRCWEPSVELFSGDNNYDLFIDQNGVPAELGSMCSTKYLERAKTISETLITAVKNNSDASDMVIGYFPSGNGCEWFLPDGRYDCSNAVLDKYRLFLKNKYNTDKDLSSAWGDTKATFQNIQIPTDVYYVLGNENPLKTTLLTEPIHQKYVDFIDFYQGAESNFILELSKFIKDQTYNRSLLGFYYGYYFEIDNPLSGVFDIETLLTSSSIDFFCGPVSYQDRNEGGAGMSMSLLNSIHANGKLWIDESDYRSPIQTAEGSDNGNVGAMNPISSKEALIEVVKRQFGKQMIYNTGTWWLDLLDKGWWDDEEFWQLNKQLTNLYSEYIENKKYKTPEVAFIYDSGATRIMTNFRQTWNGIFQDVRDDIARTGCSVGFYTIDDLANGRCMGAKLYIITTPWRISHETSLKINKVLENGSQTVLWLYGNGETSKSDFELMSGFSLEKADIENTKFQINFTPEAYNLFNNMSIKNYNMSSLYSLYFDVASQNKALGVVDNKNLFSYCSEKNSFFWGGQNIPDWLFKVITDHAGVNIFDSNKNVVYADDSLLVLHSGRSKQTNIVFPNQCDVYDYFDKKWYFDVKSINVLLEARQTKYFFFGKKSELQYLLKL
ncbi:MAG: hypothetical protein DBX47_05275 [Clostridiales bacterium]|nr:MAG: hypothetical protein DBX47_05275 [Clostridiales bacterium]